MFLFIGPQFAREWHERIFYYLKMSPKPFTWQNAARNGQIQLLAMKNIDKIVVSICQTATEDT